MLPLPWQQDCPGSLFDLKNQRLLICNEPVGKTALSKSHEQIEVQTVGGHIYTTYAECFAAHGFHTVQCSKSTCTTRSPHIQPAGFLPFSLNCVSLAFWMLPIPSMSLEPTCCVVNRTGR